LERGGEGQARAQLAHNGELIMAAALAGAAGLVVLAPSILTLLVGAAFRPAAASILPIVVAASAMAGIKAYHFDIAFHLGKHSRKLVLLAALAAVINVVLNLLLIPPLGIMGAAWATLGAYAVALVTSAVVGHRNFLDAPGIAHDIQGCAGGRGSGTGGRHFNFDGNPGVLDTSGGPARRRGRGLWIYAGTQHRRYAARIAEARWRLSLTVERTERAEAEQTMGNTRIALYLPSLRGGGAERVMVTLANGFAQRGYTVDLVLATAEGPYLEDVASNVRLVDLDTRRVSTSLPRLVRYLRRERPAALLSAMGHANVIAVLARSLAHVPTRVIVSERSNFSASRANAKNLGARLTGSLMAWAYPRADGVVAISCGVADDLARSIGLSRSSIDVVYNPVVTDDLHAKSLVSPSIPGLSRGAAGNSGRWTPNGGKRLLPRCCSPLRVCARTVWCGS
jgi:hypothetical protein